VDSCLAPPHVRVMSFFKNHGPLVGVKDILQLNSIAGRALIHYHTAVMRQESEISQKERELIAAYVSGLNACEYCHGIHSVTAESFGLEAGLIVKLLEDLDSAPIDERMKPVLVYVKQLTLQPSRLTQELVDSVLAAGWSEQALHDAINVGALFNFMNRLVEGHGVAGTQTLFEDRGRALHENGYNGLLSFLKED